MFYLNSWYLLIRKETRFNPHLQTRQPYNLCDLPITIDKDLIVACVFDFTMQQGFPAFG